MKSNLNKINEKADRIEDLKIAIRDHRNEGLNFSLSSLITMGIFSGFMPLGPLAISGGLCCLKLFFLKNKVEKEIIEFKKENFEYSVEVEKYNDQMDFLKKLSILIGKHFKETFKNYKFIKEEELCKQIKLNSPEQMDSKLIKELSIQKEILVKSQEENHYNILLYDSYNFIKKEIILFFIHLFTKMNFITLVLN